MIKLWEALVEKVNDPCWVVALSVVFLAWYAIRSAREGGREEGARAVQMLRTAMGKEKTGGSDD